MYGHRAVLPIEIVMNGIIYEIAVKSDVNDIQKGKNTTAIIAALTEKRLQNTASSKN